MVEKNESKWLEGLLLLIVIIAMIILCSVATKTKSTYANILDEQVSLWAGTVDNLQ